jgi:hypothetical protein
MSRERLDSLMGGLVQTIQRTVVDIALKIHGELVENTPVDTGWARSNWLFAVGGPAPGPVGTRESVDSSEATTQAASLVGGYRLGQGAVYITNNVPYIYDLEHGSSRQAPKGFVIRSILGGVSGAQKHKVIVALQALGAKL